MLRNCINLVAGLGIVGITIGSMGQGMILVSGCLLVGSALVAAAIASLKEK
jgi:hypothetical protein